ncbi:MAG: lamin tail domain-containing protein [Kiritimatiellales bacterium]
MKRLLSACLLACALSGAASAETLLNETFEGIFPPFGWITNSIDQADTYSHTGSYSARLNAAGDSLITPILTAPETLTLWTYTTATDPGIIVEQGFSTNGPWAAVAGSPFNGNTGQWNRRTISISSSNCLCFRFTKGGTGILYVDDVSVKDGRAISNQPPVLNLIGDRNVLEMGTFSFAVTASDPIDNDPVMLSATNLPTGTVFTNSVFTWSNAVPVGAYAVTFYATDKDGSDSETVTITVTPRPQLFISEIADPDGIGGDGGRFVELYNAGTNAINLASNRWHLSRQNNGADWSDIPLTGAVAAASTYVIAKGTNFYMAYGFQPQQMSSGVDGNGNDAYFLYYGGNHTNGTLIDIYGQPDTDGTGAAWEYTDSRAARNNSILKPNDVWRASEWTITSGAAVSNMTPGRHGPVPEFQGLENPFIFLGDSLRLTITAVNTVRTDVIRLSAASLPAGATFAAATGTNIVSSTLNWNSPTAGVYTAIFAAAGLAGTNMAAITITVSSGSQIVGKFNGWSGDTIFKLVNGQFWQQTVSGSKTVSPALYRPHITITNYLGYQRRMTVTNVTGYVAVTQLAVTESAVTNTFAGLHYQNVYRLADGTTWKQISSEIISSNAASITAWRWMKNGQQMMRFLDRNDIVIGSCTVEPFVPPADIKIHSAVVGYFYGFGYETILHLADGSWWKQISFERSASIRRNPDVLLWNEGCMNYLEMPDEGLQISAEELDVRLESTVTNDFAGLHYGNTYGLADGSDWLQLSFENISTNIAAPTVMLWIEGTQTGMLVRDHRDATVGTCIVGDPISDPDSDGQSNAAEVLAGFDPLDSQSRFELRQTDRYVLSWDAVEGRVYTIEWSPSLTERFQTLETSIVWPQSSWTDTVHAVETRGFYRIGVRLAE